MSLAALFSPSVPIDGWNRDWGLENPLTPHGLT